ncbi:unnamed protein product [Clonostachys chloroleuca]|uniref:Chromo domain-containing protein n=1 Tax=Clonostachys chloroleuca TaxID=1926264 RepID=A0AA35M1I0_9HYPO|nr:unnamed protein product [Clonostachys chloroleuca]
MPRNEILWSDEQNQRVWTVYDQDMGSDSDLEQDDDEAADNDVAILQLHEHRWEDNQIQIQVEWATGEKTWEAEDTIHALDKRILIQHWNSLGGRPLNPAHPHELNVFAVLAVRAGRRPQQFLIEWTGVEEPSWHPVEIIVDASGDEMYYFQCRLRRARGERGLGEETSEEEVSEPVSESG